MQIMNEPLQSNDSIPNNLVALVMESSLRPEDQKRLMKGYLEEALTQEDISAYIPLTQQHAAAEQGLGMPKSYSLENGTIFTLPSLLLTFGSLGAYAIHAEKIIDFNRPLELAGIALGIIGIYACFKLAYHGTIEMNTKYESLVQSAKTLGRIEADPVYQKVQGYLKADALTNA